jgi:hypothetical protein
MSRVKSPKSPAFSVLVTVSRVKPLEGVSDRRVGRGVPTAPSHHLVPIRAYSCLSAPIRGMNSSSLVPITNCLFRTWPPTFSRFNDLAIQRFDAARASRANSSYPALSGAISTFSDRCKFWTRYMLVLTGSKLDRLTIAPVAISFYFR